LSTEIGWIRQRYLGPVQAALGAGPFELARARGLSSAQGIALARQQAWLLR